MRNTKVFPVQRPLIQRTLWASQGFKPQKIHVLIAVALNWTILTEIQINVIANRAGHAL